MGYPLKKAECTFRIAESYEAFLHVTFKKHRMDGFGEMEQVDDLPLVIYRNPYLQVKICPSGAMENRWESRRFRCY